MRNMTMHRSKKNIITLWIIPVLLIAFLLTGCRVNETPKGENDYTTAEIVAQVHNDTTNVPEEGSSSQDTVQTIEWDYDSIPAYSGESPIWICNNNIPYFTEDEITDTEYESYSELDDLGRVQTAIACLGEDTLPTESRGDIQNVKPTGWKQKQYDIVNSGYLYNRCHMIAHELAGEDDNELNLLTGTRYMNVDGMLPYENMTRAYIDDTGNHVMYRVTPLFVDNELVCRGLLMEALSVEDNGSGLHFCVYCYNVQPGIDIDYLTGDSRLTEDSGIHIEQNTNTETHTYVLNTNSKKIHTPECQYAQDISEKNRKDYTGSTEDLLNKGYTKCKVCNPE